jgi:hypothetical protein
MSDRISSTRQQVFPANGTTEPKHRKGSFGTFMDRMLHPGHHDNKENPSQVKDDQEHLDPQHEDAPQKEGEMDKFKDYIKKDEQMEQEGRTYGDLM